MGAAVPQLPAPRNHAPPVQIGHSGADTVTFAWISYLESEGSRAWPGLRLGRTNPGLQTPAPGSQDTVPQPPLALS